MIDITGILTISFVNICIAELDNIKKRCKDKVWMGIILRYAESELNAIWTKTIYPWYTPGDKEMSDEEIYTLVCDLKEHFNPADFLFLKSMFTEDDEDRVFFLEQAQMISPENLRIFIISTFLSADVDENPESLSENMDNMMEFFEAPELKEFARLVDIIRMVSDESQVFRPIETAQFLNSSKLPPVVKYSLLHYIVSKAGAETGKMLINKIRIPGCKEAWRFRFVKANIFYELKEFENALEEFIKLEKSNKKPDPYYELEIRYKRAIIFRETGHEGEAILLLTKILSSENYEGSLSDYYFLTIIDLAKYYVKIKQPGEINRVLSKLPDEFIDYVEGLTGDGYLLVMADKAMLEDDFENALRFYKKAFQVNTNPLIEEKIRKLEEGI